MKELPLQFDDSNALKNAGELDHLAYQLADNEKWDQAANSLQKAADVDPNQLNRWLTIASWWQRCGQISQAIGALSQALHLSQNKKIGAPKSTFTAPVHWSAKEQISLWSGLAHLYAQDSRWPECEQACLEVLELQPDNLEITEIMSTACLQTDHLDAAEQLLQTLLRRVPLDPWYRMRYATLLQAQGRLGAAHVELERLQQMNLPAIFANEVENSIEYLDQMQFQQVIALLKHNMELRNALARNPHHELETLGFHLTETAIEMLQNVLWEHFDQAPFSAPEIAEHVPRIH